MYPIVKTIKRINALNNGIIRTPNDDKYDDIYFKLVDKRNELYENLKLWMYEQGRLCTLSRGRRAQIKLACKLLNINPHSILRSSI